MPAGSERRSLRANVRRLDPRLEADFGEPVLGAQLEREWGSRAAGRGRARTRRGRPHARRPTSATSGRARGSRSAARARSAAAGTNARRTRSCRPRCGSARGRAAGRAQRGRHRRRRSRRGSFGRPPCTSAGRRPRRPHGPLLAEGELDLLPGRVHRGSFLGATAVGFTRIGRCFRGRGFLPCRLL
jgi:hypothetical protein